jgi:probable rRNA maturation factor
MILIDPELELSRAADALNQDSAKRAAGPAAAPSRRSPAPSLRLPSTRTLARFLAEAQAAVRLRGQVTVLLTRDATMRDLNRRFRGKNKPTDVLSFPTANLIQSQYKGDLAISVETARRQSVEQGHALGVEIKILILHGLLHLAGYDHEADAGEMQRRERSLRARLGLPLGLIERAVSPTLSQKTRKDGTTLERHPSGAKALALNGRLSARLKLCPFTLTSSSPSGKRRARTMGRRKP